ncbi:MAG: helix-turn-helix transcriptional regulator [Pseudomonadota bacterium]
MNTYAGDANHILASSKTDLSKNYRICDYVVDRERDFSGLPTASLWTYNAPVVSEVCVAGARRARRVYNRGDYRLTAPGVDLFRKTDERATIRALHFGETTFEDRLGAPVEAFSAQFERLQAYAFRSALLGSVIDSLRAAMSDPRPGDALYTDSLINTAVLELWRLAGGGALTPSGADKGLPSATLRKIDRYIDDQGAAKLNAAALAEIAGMPTALFQNAFRAATGQTPYQHILSRRVANARCMVETSSLSLAEIAFRAGFSSQSHMTDVFKAKLGVTPGGLRRAAS